MHRVCGLLPKSSTLRWYTKQKEPPGLVSVRATIQDEATNIQEYIRKMLQGMLSKCLRQLKKKKWLISRSPIRGFKKAGLTDSAVVLIRPKNSS